MRCAWPTWRRSSPKRLNSGMFTTGFVNLYNDNRNALLRDPDGNLVEIVSKVRRAAD